MPRYDYKCDVCDVYSEHIHGMSESPVIHCQQCENKLHKVIIQSPQFGAVFHGYIDYGFKGGPKRITSKRQISEICKRENKIFASDKELDSECARNRVHNEKTFFEKRFKALEPKLYEAAAIPEKVSE